MGRKKRNLPVKRVCVPVNLIPTVKDLIKKYLEMNAKRTD